MIHADTFCSSPQCSINTALLWPTLLWKHPIMQALLLRSLQLFFFFFKWECLLAESWLLAVAGAALIPVWRLALHLDEFWRSTQLKAFFFLILKCNNPYAKNYCKYQALYRSARLFFSSWHGREALSHSVAFGRRTLKNCKIIVPQAITLQLQY